MTDEEIHILLSRGLDADLDRDEMRRLYRLVARRPDVVQEMGMLSELEESLQEWSEESGHLHPAPDFVKRVEQALADDLAEQNSRTKKGRFRIRSLWSWLRAPDGLSVQPLSFLTGAVAAVMVGVVGLPDIVQNTGVGLPRLKIHDLPLVQARARVDWQQRFIVMPGEATRFTLRSGGERPALIQFESVESVPVLVEHDGPGFDRRVTRTLTVDGVGYATLRHPRSGDTVLIRNKGMAPVLVYTHSLDGDGVTVRNAVGGASSTMTGFF
ncbi:MAG: hypothetical protein HQL50_11810 [Magnetococcales bacterium]|nr:hypothetical protein [Magnetococcales bacterium]